MAGQRLIGRGPIEIDSVALENWADYAVDFDNATGAPRAATVGYVPTLHAHSGWTMKASLEIPSIGRRLTTGLSLGGYLGVAFKEHSLKLEVEVKEGTGNDDWKRWAVDSYKWSVDVSKWEATDSFEVFLALLRTQAATPYAAIAYASEYGSGNVTITGGGLTRGGDVSQESLKLEGAGALTSADTLLAAALAQVTSALADGYATLATIEIPEGTGNAIFTGVEYKIPAGDKVTASVDWRGDGEFAEIEA
jgi:hypothetical protein